MRSLVVLAALSAVLAASFAFFTGPGRVSAQAPSVQLVAIDMAPAGNTCNSVGTVESSLGNVPLNTPTVIDVIVRGVPAGPALEDGGGIFGSGFELLYNPAVIRVTGGAGGTGNVLHLCAAGGIPFELNDPVPDTDGSFRADTADLSGNEESGDGRLFSVTIECIAQGSSFLALTDTSTGGGDNAGVVGDSGAFVYTVQQEQEGNIGCGTTAGTETPPPTASPPPTNPPTNPPTVSPTVRVSPTQGPTATPSRTATPTPARTGTGSVTPTAAGQAAASGTPRQLPRTGADDGGGSTELLIIALLTGAAVAAGAGGFAYKRYRQNDQEPS
jgi:hypothetical protein